MLSNLKAGILATIRLILAIARVCAGSFWCTGDSQSVTEVEAGVCVVSFAAELGEIDVSGRRGRG
jgi:hypothetical protein